MSRSLALPGSSGARRTLLPCPAAGLRGLQGRAWLRSVNTAKAVRSAALFSAAEQTASPRWPAQVPLSSVKKAALVVARRFLRAMAYGEHDRICSRAATDKAIAAGWPAAAPRASLSQSPRMSFSSSPSRQAPSPLGESARDTAAARLNDLGGECKRSQTCVVLGVFRSLLCHNHLHGHAERHCSLHYIIDRAEVTAARAVPFGAVRTLIGRKGPVVQVRQTVRGRSRHSSGSTICACIAISASVGRSLIPTRLRSR